MCNRSGSGAGELPNEIICRPKENGVNKLVESLHVIACSTTAAVVTYVVVPVVEIKHDVFLTKKAFNTTCIRALYGTVPVGYFN